MIKKYLGLIVVAIFLALSAGIVLAANEPVAYVVAAVTHNGTHLINATEDPIIVDILTNDMGYNVTIVYGRDLSNFSYDANFSQYDMIVVGNGSIPAWNKIPVHDIPTLIMNPAYVDEWKLGDGTVPIGSDYLLGELVYDMTILDDNLTEPLILYYSSSTTATWAYALPKRPDRAVGIFNIIQPTQASLSNTVLVGTMYAGGELFDGSTTNDKIVYFGLPGTSTWTNDTEEVFRRGLDWLINDYETPVLSNIRVEDLTNHSGTVKWETDWTTNSSITYGEEITLSSGTVTLNNATRSNNHSMPLSDLKELTMYYYKVTSCSELGYCAESGVLNFTTLDQTPPHLVNQSVTNLTNGSAIVSANVSEISNVTLHYGTNQSALANQMEAYLTSSPTFQLASLIENTHYFYRFEMCDIFNNCANSTLFDFTTEDWTAPGAPVNLMLEVNNTDGSINISWEDPIGEEVAYYNIYMSDSADINGFNFSSPNITTSLNSYIDYDTADKEKYYIVRSEDAAGNEENNTFIVGKYDFSLLQGKNLISIPLVPFDPNVSAVMHQDASYNPISEIRRFNTTTQEFDAVAFNAGTEMWEAVSGLAGMENIITLEGYFLTSTSAIDFTVVGIVPDNATVELKTGMNLVGLTLFDQVVLSGFDPTIYNIREISDRNVDGSYNVATYYATNWYGDYFDLDSGEGYWVKVDSDNSIVVVA